MRVSADGVYRWSVVPAMTDDDDDGDPHLWLDVLLIMLVLAIGITLLYRYLLVP